MALITFKKNETDVKTLVKRLYPDADAIALVKIEAALIKENPHLLKVETIRPGIVVTVPKIPGITARPVTDSDDPVEEIQKMLVVTMKDFQKNTEQRMAKAFDEIGVQKQMVNDGTVRKAIDKSGQKAQDLAGRLEKNLAARVELFAQEKQAQKELFVKVIEDLQGMAKW